MPAPYMTLISTQTVGAGGAASIDFTGIASSFTDLLIVLSARSSRADTNDEVIVRFNGSTTGYSYRELQGNGTSATSFGNTNNGIYRGAVPAANYTANTFSNNQIYIPNYAGSTAKSVSLDTTAENNATGTRMTIIGGTWSGTAAITQVTLTPEVGSFVQYSTASLYGITKASAISPTAKATGGTITYDNFGNVYHTFTASGTFTPTTALTADVLVIAGGGSGGVDGVGGGGGGAGGLQLLSSQSLTTTGYSVVVGAGAARSSSSSQRNAGNDSSFNGTSSTGGGGGGSNDGAISAGGPGGSGGGGHGAGGGSQASGGTGVEGQGNNGGRSTGGVPGGGGGGGAGATGGIGNNTGGAGGSGTNLYSTWALVTGTGVSGYYAGGGGGGSNNSYGGGAAGVGGGAAGKGGAGTANTGGGGGGSGASGSDNGGGGSGLVIVKYAGV